MSGFDCPLDLAQLGTPANPASGRNKVYFKSDGILYQLDASGVETAVSPKAAWTAYTPALTNMSVGNGTMVAAFSSNGVTINFRFRLVFGSTSAISGAVTVGLPATVGSVAQLGVCFVGTSGGTVPLGGVAFIPNGATTFQPFCCTNTTNNGQAQLGTVGLTMGTSAYVMAQGTYERS